MLVLKKSALQSAPHASMWRTFWGAAVLYGSIVGTVCAQTPTVETLSQAAPISVSSGQGTPSAKVPSVGALMAAVMQNQPELKTLPGYSELSSRYQAASERWFSNGMTLSLRHESDALTDDTGFQSWESGVSFPLGLGAQSQATAELAQEYRHQGEAYQALLNWQVSLQVRELWWNVKSAELQWQRSAQNQAIMAEWVSKVAAQVASGDAPQMDLVMARKEALEIDKQAMLARNQYDQQWQLYHYWSGFSQLPEQLEKPLEDTDLMAHLDDHLQKHPQWVWEKRQLQILQASSHWEQSQNAPRPDLFVGAKSEQDDQTAARTSLMLELSVPIGKPAAFDIAFAEQRQAIRQQQAQIEKRYQLLETQARQSYQAWQQSIALFEVAQQQVDLAQQALTMAEKAYEVGETPVQTLLQSQRQWLQAQLQLEQQQSSTRRAQSMLRQALGWSLDDATRLSEAAQP